MPMCTPSPKPHQKPDAAISYSESFNATGWLSSGIISSVNLFTTETSKLFTYDGTSKVESSGSARRLLDGAKFRTQRAASALHEKCGYCNMKLPADFARLARRRHDAPSSSRIGQ